MIDNDDLKLLLREYLKENLSLEVQAGDFTDPNNRTILLKIGDEVISRSFLDVRQIQEYQG